MAAGHGHFFLILLFCFYCTFFTSCPLFILPVSSAAQLGEAYHHCLHNATSPDTNASLPLSTTFKANLNSALHNLTKLASDGTTYAIVSAHTHSLCLSTSHNLSSYGPLCDTSIISASSDADTAYAMYQCRGDQSLPECATCVANATARLSQTLCPSSIGARIQLDGCYLRYDNQTFFTPDFGFVLGFCYVPTNDTVALTAIDSLVSYVTTQAPNNNGYASKSASSEYALAQCLGYLDDSECYQCLTSQSYRLLCAPDTVLGEQLHLGSCYLRFEPYLFFDMPPPPPPPAVLKTPASTPRPAALEASPTQGSKVAVVAGSVVAGAVFIMAVLCITLVLYRQRNGKGKGKIQENDNYSDPLFKPKADVFSLHDLEVATGHFHLNNKLGEGGFGSVFKGTLQNGQEIAVKKLFLGGHEGNQEFLNEVRLITMVQHKNLIKLLGSCVEGPERMLVYEYLPNGSVDKLLFGNTNETLDWRARHGIILGMARGLAYLHEESQVRIIHRDIKPSNILVDDRLNPVIADFGIARLFLENESHINTRVVGTIGYLAPEYMVCRELTEKVDVFSFGVVTLEIITGRKNSTDNIVEQIWMLHQNQQEIELVDPRLGTSFSTQEVIRAMHIALLCVQEVPKRRPNMSSVTLLLSGNSHIIDEPAKPAFARLTRKWKDFPSSTLESISL